MDKRRGKASLSCSKAALKGQWVLNLIKLCFKHLGAFIQLFFYIKLLPLFEYCSLARRPYFSKDIIFAQRVQRRMTGMIPHLRKMKYKDRRVCLNLRTLSQRRFGLICVFPIFHDLIEIDPLFFNANDLPVTQSLAYC